MGWPFPPSAPILSLCGALTPLGCGDTVCACAMGPDTARLKIASETVAHNSTTPAAYNRLARTSFIFVTTRSDLECTHDGFRQSPPLPIFEHNLEPEVAPQALQCLCHFSTSRLLRSSRNCLHIVRKTSGAVSQA